MFRERLGNRWLHFGQSQTPLLKQLSFDLLKTTSRCLYICRPLSKLHLLAALAKSQ